MLSSDKYCQECDRVKNESYCDFCKKETANHFTKSLFDQVKMKSSLGCKQKRLGVRGFLKKIFQGYQASADANKYPDGAERQVSIDRENDWYDEKVINNKTGEITEECHEKLSEHKGHGSAKK